MRPTDSSMSRPVLFATVLGLALVASGCGKGEDPDTAAPPTTPTTTTPPIADADGDGFDAEADCDDADALVNPSATEQPYDGVDNDCSAATPDDDLDGDGHPKASDCDDADASVHPGVAEAPYDGVDNDCSAATPDDDLDGDGFGHVTDCDDTDAGVLLGGTEVPYDGLDNDCDAATRDDDVDGDGFALADDCDDADALVNPSATEQPYDGVDNDCSAATPDDDLDGDGYPLASDCDDGAANRSPGLTEVPYDGVDNDCDAASPDDDLDEDGYPLASDCDDGDPGVNPGVSELVYDGLDNDCDPGTLDDDLDGDGYPFAEDCLDDDPTVFNEVDGACALGHSCKDLLQNGFGTADGEYLIDTDGPRSGRPPVLVSCDQTTAGGGWTLVLHMYDMDALNEDQFVGAVGSDDFTDHDWTWDSVSDVVSTGITDLTTFGGQGALDIDRFGFQWNDVRMTCSNTSFDPTEEHYVLVDQYTWANFNYNLLGSAPNATTYPVDPATNSMGLSTVWHDNELDGLNEAHYLCDRTEGGPNGTTQFGFCYSNPLVNDGDNNKSIVSLSFGWMEGPDMWSEGFTLECGARNAIQNQGTVSIWIR